MLLAVSGHTEEVETTHVSVTHSVIFFSQSCSTLTGINSVSLDLGMTDQVGQAASSSVFAAFFYQTPFRGFVFAASSPPTKLWFGRYRALVPSGFTAIVWFAWGPWWVCSSVFSDVTCTPTGSVGGIGWNIPTIDSWIGSTSNFFAESTT